MFIARSLAAGALVALAAVSPAHAATNLIKNGSFEAGAAGNGTVPNWTKSNTPTGSAGTGDVKASVIKYNFSGAYPQSLYFGEIQAPDDIVGSGSPDAVGNKAAYFVGDWSENETWSQLTYLLPGNYQVGFSYSLPFGGINNPNNASLDVKILNIPVAFTSIDGSTPDSTWFYASGVGTITTAGWYTTNMVYNANGFPSKDIVIDRVFAIRTNLPCTGNACNIPPDISTVPEPQSWALMIIGFGLVGVTARRRKGAAVAA